MIAEAAGPGQAESLAALKIELDKIAAHLDLEYDMPSERKQRANPVRAHSSVSCQTTSLDNPLLRQRLSRFLKDISSARLNKRQEKLLTSCA